MNVSGLAAGDRSAGLHLGGGQEEAVGLGVHAHGARSRGRLDGLQDLECSGLLGGDGQGAVSRAGEGQARAAAVASTPAPMGSAASTLPVSSFITTSRCGLRQPMKRRWLAASMAMPTG